MTNFSPSLFNTGNIFANHNLSAADRSYAMKVVQSPLFQRLTASGLVSLKEADICRWVQEWRCVGGSFVDVLAARTRLSLQTIRFFSQQDPIPASGRRIGDYLVSAGLVSQLAIRQTISDLQASGKRQLLGQALADRRHISHHTADYFAKTYTAGPTASPASEASYSSPPAPSDFDNCMTTPCQKRRQSLEGFFQAAADAVAYSRNVTPKLRRQAAEMLEAYPNHSKVKYWCARLGIAKH